MLYKDNKKIGYFRKNDRNYQSKKENIFKIIDKIFVKVRYEKIEDGVIIIVPKYNRYRRFLKKIILRQINNNKEIRELDYIVYDNELGCLNKELNFVNILNEKLLMKSLILKIFQYIFMINKGNISLENVYIFVNSYNKNNIYLIEKLIANFKTVNIITENIRYYKRLEEKLYEQGVLITVSNNKRKSARNAKYIINLDFENIKFKEYCLNNNAIIINANNEELSVENGFNGVIVNDFEVDIDNDMKDFVKEYYGNFDMKNFVENFLINRYSNFDFLECFYNEKKLEINGLIGKRGKLNNSEFLL